MLHAPRTQHSRGPKAKLLHKRRTDISLSNRELHLGPTIRKKPGMRMTHPQRRSVCHSSRLRPTLRGKTVQVGASSPARLHLRTPASVGLRLPQAVTSQAARQSASSSLSLKKSRGCRGFSRRGRSFRPGAETWTHLFSCPAETSGEGERRRGCARILRSAGADNSVQTRPTSSNRASRRAIPCWKLHFPEVRATRLIIPSPPNPQLLTVIYSAFSGARFPPTAHVVI